MSRAPAPAPAVQPTLSAACAALSPLEGPINRALKLAKLLKLVAEVRDEGGTPTFLEDCAKGMSFLADEIHAQVDAIEDLWTASWNAAPDVDAREVAR